MSTHRTRLHTPAIEEAKALVRRCAEPRPVGDFVKVAIGRASERLEMPYARVRELWYGDARRIDAQEMDRLRLTASRMELTTAIADVELLKNRMLAHTFERTDEIVAGLDAALMALRQSPVKNIHPAAIRVSETRTLMAGTHP